MRLSALPLLLALVAFASPAAAEVDPPSAAEPELKHFALTLNPLAFAVQRVGINVEYMLARHHGLIAEPFFQALSVGDEPSTTSYTNVGGELGYRFYTGSRGANGFFIGPFGTFIASSASATVVAGGNSSTSESSISIYGGGVDLGGQHVFRNGFTIGGGAGVVYLVSSDPVSESSSYKVEGLLPRFLFTVGWAF